LREFGTARCVRALIRDSISRYHRHIEYPGRFCGMPGNDLARLTAGTGGPAAPAWRSRPGVARGSAGRWSALAVAPRNCPFAPAYSEGLPAALAGLERRRAELFALLAQVGDFRRGTLNAHMPSCPPLTPSGGRPESVTVTRGQPARPYELGRRTWC
jgi:hypothetical protein